MIKTDKNVRGSHKMYKGVSQNPIDLKRYIELCNGYHKFLMGKVLEGHEVMMPSKMGMISIQGSKRKITFDENGKPNLAPDWQKTRAFWASHPGTKEEGKKIYHTNDHTGGVRYKFHWSKKRVIIKNKTLYSMQLTRANKRAISAEIKQGQEYFVKY